VTARCEIAVYPDLGTLSRAAAETIAEAARSAVATRGRFTIALAGGRTPRTLYELLAAGGGGTVPWADTHVFFSDERCVPPDDPASNYRMVRVALLDRVPGLASRTHRIEGERPPSESASRYEAELRAAFDQPGGRPDDETFDVAVLGLGPDGHTASLFPGSLALEEGVRWVAPATAPPDAPVRQRITLTFPPLDAARTVVLLCAGADKRDIVARIRADGPRAAERYPAARVTARERLWWLLDAEAFPEAEGPNQPA
jgi:6-phosphogluconolactonase